MARILVYADSPTAPTGFGRSAKHVLHALHAAGHELVQLAVNHHPGTTAQIPWKVYTPTTPGDPYGLADLARIIRSEAPFDLLWSTFDPECPWGYVVPGLDRQMTVLQMLQSLRQSNPGFRLMGWFPVDAGPLSDFELAVLGSPDVFDLAATMSTHVHDLVEWSLKLRGHPAPSREVIANRIKVVPHGIDLDAYQVAADEQRREAKARLGFDPDAFLIVQVERNQPRKMPYNGLALLDKLRHGRKLARPVFLYQHMMEDEENQGCRVGYRMRELAWRYGLRADVDVKWAPRSFTDAEMVAITYAAADVVFSGSAGEGFQYPLWEALACGRRVVAPRDTARAAWLSHTPGAYLYHSELASNVIRGSYNRRMNRPDLDDAASIIGKMVDGRSKFRECPEASRSWVAQRADVAKVQKWWVDEVATQLQFLAADRAARKVTVSGPPADVVLDMRANLGLGDCVAAGAAIRAYRAENPGVTVNWALPGNQLHLPVAQWLGVADAVQVQPAVPIEELGRTVLSPQWPWFEGPKAAIHAGGYQNTRTREVARALGVSDANELDAHFPAPPKLVESASKQLLTTYGVPADRCVLLALESAQPNRSWPRNFIPTLADMVQGLGFTPVLVGREALNIKTVGVIDLTGQTDVVGLMGLVGACHATVAVDSFPMHLAAAMGRPLVALVALYPGPYLLGHYRGPIALVQPAPVGAFPPGETGGLEWVQSLRPAMALAALKDLLAKVEAGA